MYGFPVRIYDYGGLVWDMHPFNTNEECTMEVVPSTIGQFTGLTDKNGKEIFEGDIVRSFSSGKEHIGVVNWNKLFSSWHIGEYATLYGSENFSDNEVIGNIHDNPELLEAD
jgi:uncharacterized phage protein (TIGR01671 family)